jgi:hypothetical protein
MANQGLGTVTQAEPDYTSVIGCEDVATKCIELLTTPNALLEFYLDLSRTRSLSGPIVRAFALLLLPRLKLDLPLNSKYLDRLFVDALKNSSLANLVFEFLPPNLKERFIVSSPFAGFEQFIVTRDISPAENDRTLSILGPNSPNSGLDYQLKAAAFQSALGLLLEDEHSINEDLGNCKLPVYEQEQSLSVTANLIMGLGDYFAQQDYAGLHYQQLIVVAECIAYTKRFYRRYWRVEIEDVLQAWFFINFFKRPRPPLSQNSKKILLYIWRQNAEGKFPTQRQIIKKTGLSTKVVSNAVGLKIKRPEGSGRLIIEGHVEYNIDQQGYQLSQLGEFALTNDFHVTVDGTTFRPKSIPEE